MNRLGTVTQFEVLGDEDADPAVVGAAIDEGFATAESPTDTRPRIAYLESATRDLREILRFGRLLGLACIVVVLSLVANTVIIAAQERVRETAVLRAIGFREGHIASLVLGEALALSLTGAALGVGGALVLLTTVHPTIGSEGISVEFLVTPELIGNGFLLALGTGIAAGLLPAIRSARAGIVDSLVS